MDRHALVEVVKDTAPMQVGGFVYPFHEFSTPRAELEKRLGYQADVTPAVQEARRLMREAGYGPGIKGPHFVVPDIAPLKLWGGGVPAQLQEDINRGTELPGVQESGWVGQAAGGQLCP